MYPQSARTPDKTTSRSGTFGLGDSESEDENPPPQIQEQARQPEQIEERTEEQARQPDQIEELEEDQESSSTSEDTEDNDPPEEPEEFPKNNQEPPQQEEEEQDSENEWPRTESEEEFEPFTEEPGLPEDNDPVPGYRIIPQTDERIILEEQATPIPELDILTEIQAPIIIDPIDPPQNPTPIAIEPIDPPQVPAPIIIDPIDLPQDPLDIILPELPNSPILSDSSDDGIQDPQMTTPTKEIGRTPLDFDGNPSRYSSWLADVEDYVQLNPTIYNNDTKQVVFTLGLLTSGTAAAFKHQYWLNHTGINQVRTYGTFEELKTEMNRYFRTKERKDDALNYLDSIQQGKTTVDEYNNWFNLMVQESGLDRTHNATVLIRQYRKGLRPQIVDKIIGQIAVPTTLDNWQAQALQLDRNWREHRFNGKIVNPFANMNFFPSRNSGNGYSSNFGQPQARSNNSYRDPMAMDIDALTLQQRQDCMAKGLCFRCKQQGHLSKDCPKKNRQYQQNNSQASGSSSTNSTQKPAGYFNKLNRPQKAQYIHALLKDMPVEEWRAVQTMYEGLMDPKPQDEEDKTDF